MFDSLKKILPQIERQPGWEEYRQYRQLLEYWQKIVTSTTARHTRPLYLKKGVLWVATSSSARAQELSFQRYSLLKKLNSQLSFTLRDIRFSTSQWHQATKDKNGLDNSQQSLQDSLSPFQRSGDRKKTLVSSIQEPKAAVRGWIELFKVRSQHLPLCPQCSAPTPEAELQRWGKCYHCDAQLRFEDYRPVNLTSNNNNNNLKKPTET